MALRRDYSLTKEIVFEENEDLIYSLYEKYDLPYIQGQYYKDMLWEYITFHKGICGKGEDINELFDLLYRYASINVADTYYTYVDEATNLRDAYFGLTKYNMTLDAVNEELSRTIDGWLASADTKTINIKQRKQELTIIGQIENIINRRSFVYESIQLIKAMMQGSLAEGFPEEKDRPDSPYGFLNMPMMTHIPCIDDLNEAELMYSPLIQVLYNVIALNSYVPIDICHDYDNGHVCVRLWRKEQEKYVPFYASISKYEIYDNKIENYNQKTIWPGIIEAAFEKFGLPKTKEEIVEAILGPATSQYDMAYLCGENIRPAKNWSDDLTEAIRSYIKCLYDIYSSFLLTYSLLTEDEVPFVKLQYGLKACMDVVACCVGQTLDLAQNAVKGLSELLSEYRESVAAQTTSVTVRKRLSICDTADSLLELFNCNSEFYLTPHIYFESFLAEKIAKLILSSNSEELTKEAVNEKVRAVITDSDFREAVSKMNIHILKNADEKVTESVLAKMEGQY